MSLEGARFADEHGFSAVWTPERHFHSFGGIYPNPSVTSAAIATITQHIAIRAGSVVVPLHDPLRVAEEWSVVDNLLGLGRVAISFASGWHANDFILSPEHYDHRRQIAATQIETIRALWRGQSLRRTNGVGEEVEVKVSLPAPRCNRSCPSGSLRAARRKHFGKPAKIGANLLTHLLGQDLDELAEKIALYRSAYREAGHRGRGKVALMIHTYVGATADAARETVREPFGRYLEESVDLLRKLLPEQDFSELSRADLDALLQHAFQPVL